MPAEIPVARILGKENLEEITTEDLRNLVRQYPYFSFAQVILSMKLHSESDEEGFHKQLSRTAIYMPAPFLLDKLLLHTSTLFPIKSPLVSEVVSTVPEPETPEIPAEITEIEIIAGNPVTQVSQEDAPVNPASPRHLPSLEITGPEEKNSLALDSKGKDELHQLVRPLYMEDYFAFQGIQLPDNLDDTKKPTSAQLRTFTDWLRIMKRPRRALESETPELHGKNRISSIYTADEESGISHAVEKMALDSINADEEVMTEAMAEIRIRQGQWQKAKAIYEKLSLLNPGKSSYFAAKIAEFQQYP